MNASELREKCAQKLEASVEASKNLTAFVGLDGFVDEIIHVVDKRDNAECFQRVPTIAALGERIKAAAGKSTNIELVNQRTKLGGNGPIMANALASFGLKVTYLGALGYPHLHPVFQEFAQKAEVHSIAEAGHTDALEFEDGKLMFGKTVQLNDMTWPNIQSRFGRDQFATKFGCSDLVGFVNWTMIPYMSDLWESLLTELGPDIKNRRKIFFDLADPEKRNKGDISRALGIISRFEKYFDVILGLNEKEAYEIAAVLGYDSTDRSPAGLSALSIMIGEALKINTLVVHPVTYALGVSGGVASLVEGPYVAKPLITTGAGDHFNSGFCLGKLLGFDNSMAILTGVATSGFYVRTAQSPNMVQLAEMMRNWPQRDK
jgi:sugar/nucleoside kinase (ribokinase family)